MFGIVTILGFAGALVALGGYHAIAGGHAALEPGRRASLWDKLVYLLLVLGTVTLVATGFLAVYLPGGLSGWLLMAHFTGAPAFMVGLALAALSWAGRAAAPDPNSPSRSRAFTQGQKCVFWSAAVLGVVTVTPILLSMLPLLSSHAQHTLVAIHRYGALGMLLILLANLYQMTLGRPKALPPAVPVNSSATQTVQNR